MTACVPNSLLPSFTSAATLKGPAVALCATLCPPIGFKLYQDEVEFYLLGSSAPLHFCLSVEAIPPSRDFICQLGTLSFISISFRTAWASAHYLKFHPVSPSLTNSLSRFVGITQPVNILEAIGLYTLKWEVLWI